MATFYMTADAEMYHCGLGYSDELYHYGVLGMKWGVRRYQNKDGSLTAEGKIKYGTVGKKMSKSDATRYKKAAKLYNETIVDSERNDLAYIEARKKHEKALKKYGKDSAKEKAARQKRAYYGLMMRAKHENVYDVMTQFQKKYGTSRIKDIPTKNTKYGEITYRKMISTPEFGAMSAWTVLGALSATAATGSLYLPNAIMVPAMTKILRKAAAKNYARKEEKEFYERTGRKMDDLSWYNDKRRITVEA